MIGITSFMFYNIFTMSMLALPMLAHRNLIYPVSLIGSCTFITNELKININFPIKIPKSIQEHPLNFINKTISTRKDFPHFNDSDLKTKIKIIFHDSIVNQILCYLSFKLSFLLEDENYTNILIPAILSSIKILNTISYVTKQE